MCFRGYIKYFEAFVVIPVKFCPQYTKSRDRAQNLVQLNRMWGAMPNADLKLWRKNLFEFLQRTSLSRVPISSAVDKCRGCSNALRSIKSVNELYKMQPHLNAMESTAG